MFLRRYALCSLLILFVAACTQSSQPSSSRATVTSPTAPTAGSPSGPAAGIDLTTVTAAGAPGAGYEKPVVGTVSSVSGTCPNLTFVVSGVTVKLTASTTFDAGVCSDLRTGSVAGAIGTKNADGSINATRVKVGSPSQPMPPKPPTPPTPPPGVAGAISALSGSCPSVTFTLGGTSVQTSSTTAFDGGTCADLKDGIRAGAVGPKDSSGVIHAERVKIAPPSMPAASGTVASLAGTCPAVTFTLSGTTVRTSATTRFDGGTCAGVQNGVRAGAMGTKAPDGAIDAHFVKLAPAK